MFSPPSPAFSSLIDAWLTRKDLTCAAAARAFGTSWTTVDAWRRGLSRPPATRRPWVAQVLGITVEELNAAIKAERRSSADLPPVAGRDVQRIDPQPASQPAGSW